MGANTRTYQQVWAAQVWGLCLLIFVSFYPKLFHLQEYLFFTLLIVGLGTAWLEGQQVWVRTPLDVPIFLLIGWTLFTIPFAFDPSYSFSEWRKFLAHVLVFFWTLLVLERAGNHVTFRKIVLSLLFGGLIISLYATTEFVLRGGSLVDRNIRAHAPGSGFQQLSTYLVLVPPFVFVMFMSANKWTNRLAWVGVMMAAMLAQVLSYTRAGWLGIASQMCAIGWFVNRRFFLLVSTGLLLSVFIIRMLLLQSEYQTEMLGFVTIWNRVLLWELAIEEMLSNPFVGIGYGNDTFHQVLGQRIQEAGIVETVHVHNLFLSIGLGSGVPALVFLMWMFLGILKEVWWRTWAQHREVFTSLSFAIGLVTVGFMVRNVFDNMFTGSIAHLFWIIAACGMSLQKLGIDGVGPIFSCDSKPNTVP